MLETMLRLRRRGATGSLGLLVIETMPMPWAAGSEVEGQLSWLRQSLRSDDCRMGRLGRRAAGCETSAPVATVVVRTILQSLLKVDWTPRTLL